MEADETAFITDVRMTDFTKADNAVSVFSVEAEAFCALVERHESIGRDGFLHAVLTRLPLLYSAALALPAVEGDKDDGDIEDVEQEDELDSVEDADSLGDDDQDDRLSCELWNLLFDSLRSLIDEGDYYSVVFSPYAQPPDEPVTGSLADDIADIYRDLLDGLAKWRRGEVDAAVWEWWIGFTSHWGEHVTSALRALHALAADCDLGFPRPNS